LRDDPNGRRRSREAFEYEDKWWDCMIRNTSNDPRQRRILRRIKEDRLAKNASFEPRPVHRLDIDTSGIVCIALTPYALRAANMMFERKSRRGIGDFGDDDADDIGLVRKNYVALVEGTFDDEGAVSSTGIIDRAIGKVWIDDHHEWACDISIDGAATAFIRPGDDSSVLSFVDGTLREAVTSYRALAPTSDDIATVDATRVELTPHTGRGHQLRLHMASIGHPIVGDPVRLGSNHVMGLYLNACITLTSSV
jgi:23S rRNA-/tRNA-specific pseudouridylate synthase